MNQLKKQGIAVMFVSSEMPEVMGVADRIIVMCDGRITGKVMAKETTQNDILKYATSFENKLGSQSQNNKEGIIMKKKKRLSKIMGAKGAGTVVTAS